MSAHQYDHSLEALRALLLAASKLRLRIIPHAFVVTRFSEWDELTSAMSLAERAISQAEMAKLEQVTGD